jgi:hypothetical protein
MGKKISKLLGNITDHTSDIIFGILSGTGLMFIISAIINVIVIILPSLKHYFLIMYASLYLFVLILTAILYTKGWFRTIYLTSALILLLTYIYIEIFGAIQ